MKRVRGNCDEEKIALILALCMSLELTMINVSLAATKATEAVVAAKEKSKADNSNVKVTGSGKISAKSSVTSKVTANVTMKNGAKKSIKMKVSVS